MSDVREQLEEAVAATAVDPGNGNDNATEDGGGVATTRDDLAPAKPDAIATALAMDVPYIPLYDQVLVKPLKPEEISKGGIIIPENAQERAQAGIVLACGPGIQTATGFINVEVWRGDVVLFGKYAGFEVGVEKLSKIAGDEIISDTENLVTLRAQEIRLVRTPRPANPHIKAMEAVYESHLETARLAGSVRRKLFPDQRDGGGV